MKGAGPVMAAGGAFTGCALAGLLGGIWLSQRTGAGLWVVGGLFGGIGLGAFSAVRLLLRSV